MNKDVNFVFLKVTLYLWNMLKYIVYTNLAMKGLQFPNSISAVLNLFKTWDHIHAFLPAHGAPGYE